VPVDLQRAFERNWARWSIEAAPEVDGELLGFDVVFPFPSFHSAIRQPVLSEVEPEFVDDLSEVGLFPAIELARSAAEVCNRRDTAWRPFCTVAVSRAE
jgi:hypothetical protein